MTAEEQRQVRNSVIAIVLCIIFLWSGKKFIWNNAVAKDDPPQDIPPVSDSVAELPGETTTTTASEPYLVPDTTTAPGALIPGDTTVPLNTDQTTAATPAAETTTAATTTTTAETTTAPQANGLTQAGFVPAPDGYFNDALFVGDSRTVGLANYAPIEGAEYFATVGLSTYKVNTSKSEVGNSKNLSFAQLLASRKFGKIYLMLGINEIGNNRTATLEKYKEIVDQIRKAQPDAILFIEANLHVAQSRSSTDAVVNNTQINSFNEATASYADGKSVFYLDVNPVFDDASGALGAEYTHDGTHPLAKYYQTWDEFLMANAIVK